MLSGPIKQSPDRSQQLFAPVLQLRKLAVCLGQVLTMLRLVGQLVALTALLVDLLLVLVLALMEDVTAVAQGSSVVLRVRLARPAQVLAVVRGLLMVGQRAAVEVGSRVAKT